jgi:hypothetical protein
MRSKLLPLELRAQNMLLASRRNDEDRVSGGESDFQTIPQMVHPGPLIAPLLALSHRIRLFTFPISALGSVAT